MPYYFARKVTKNCCELVVRSGRVGRRHYARGGTLTLDLGPMTLKFLPEFNDKGVVTISEVILR